MAEKDPAAPGPHEPRDETGAATGLEPTEHEVSDVNIVAILKFGVAMVLVALIVHIGVAWLFDLFASDVQRAQKKLSPLAEQGRPHLPRDLHKIPEPRLQPLEHVDLEALRQAEEAKLKDYQWVDRKAEVVRIPIERAIQLLSDPATAASHGLRSRPTPKKE